MSVHCTARCRCQETRLGVLAMSAGWCRGYPAPPRGVAFSHGASVDNGAVMTAGGGGGDYHIIEVANIVMGAGIEVGTRTKM